MFKTETIKCKGKKSAMDTATEMVKAQAEGMRMIGSGCYGYVYGVKGSDVVYKVGDANDNAGYLSYIDQLKRTKKHNPFTPKIYGVRIYEGVYGEKAFVVAMERLTPHKSNAQRIMMHKVASWFEDNLTEDYDRTDMSCPALGVQVTMPDALTECVAMIRKAYDNGRFFGDWVDYDFHAGNFMFRGKQVVCIDPLA
jgi:hypothetical protein